MTPRAQSGFTLIELLVVVLIFSIFALMAYGGLDVVLKSRVQVESALARTAALQKAYARLRDDFQQVRNRPARDAFGDPQPPLRLERATASERVEFTRSGWRNPLYLPRASLERVSYRIDDGKLLRESFRVLDQAQDSKPVSAVVLEDVTEARWRFLDGDRAWQTAWPPESVGAAAEGVSALPLAVELVLETKDIGTLTFLYRLGIEPAQIPASGAPQAGGQQQQQQQQQQQGGGQS